MTNEPLAEVVHTEKLPEVSVLVVVRNEADNIENCLYSILRQDLPGERYEVLVIDGMSTDGTREKVQEFIRQNPDYEIRLLDNPGKILSSGWNIGVRNARGFYVTRPDTHAELSGTFLSDSLRVMRAHPESSAVGGVMETKGKGYAGEIIASALSSRFGVGGGQFRIGGKPGPADTAVFALYKRSVLMDVGGFDEHLKRNQDLLCHGRIKAGGGQFYFDPLIRSTYYCRNTVSALSRQMFGNGHWLALLIRHKKGRSFSGRHLIPLVFILMLTGLLLASWWFVWSRWALIGLLATYLLGASSAAVQTNLTFVKKLIFPLVTFVMHISYGAGWLTGLIRLPFYRPAKRCENQTCSQ